MQALLRHASDAKRSAEFWSAVAGILSEWSGGARVAIRYQGINESGSVHAGSDDRSEGGGTLTAQWRDPEGRLVEATLAGAPAALPASELEAAIEFSSRLAVMVGRRAALERERRLGTFMVELARWLLAAPETQLLLRYTVQSLMELAEAHGAFVALKQPDGNLRLSPALGEAAPIEGLILGRETSVAGRVVRTGEALITSDLRADDDASPIANALGTGVRAALFAPLRTSHGTVGAIGLLRYQAEGGPVTPPFTLQDLHYVSAVAAHIAGGIELSEAVAATRAAADQARAMVDASPLPMAVVDTTGTVRQVNEAAIHIFGVKTKDAALGRHLERLGLSPSGLTVRLMLQGRPQGQPWHGRVLVTQPQEGERRICDCTVTDLRGLGSQDLLVALYDRTEELRAQRELIAREKLATVGEIASGVAHEVNNPLTAIRMEAELLARSTRDTEASTAAATIVREVDRAARIVRSLLRLARRADSTPVRVQLNDLVRDVAEIRQRVLRADNIEVRTRMDQGAEAVLGLGQELQQVVINLVTNAEHAVRGRPHAVIELATEAHQGWTRLTVEDSGPGVPAEVRSRVFDPFFTTKSPDEGSGLGLSICQRVVAEVGGKIWLEDSITLGGAKFIVELPAAPMQDSAIG